MGNTACSTFCLCVPCDFWLNCCAGPRQQPAASRYAQPPPTTETMAMAAAYTDPSDAGKASS
ncbi:hypothetical protein E2562_016155 [Oryza meyeriana var. granulata]|uniref:Uncharacterized protein n=1 Tax=Oryza meyeriana var. granulata TaxID=110450 RepID=A0A6G1F8I6_9ORYZ|nr:hypothetical protein E2562_016155 [Oryza meyeriana var. granulata]